MVRDKATVDEGCFAVVQEYRPPTLSPVGRKDATDEPWGRVLSGPDPAAFISDDVSHETAVFDQRRSAPQHHSSADGNPHAVPARVTAPTSNTKSSDDERVVGRTHAGDDRLIKCHRIDHCSRGAVLSIQHKCLTTQSDCLTVRPGCHHDMIARPGTINRRLNRREIPRHANRGRGCQSGRG